MSKDIVIPKMFFKRPVLTVAPDMLGKVLAVRTANGIVRSVITEVEAYDGEEDKACHASKGRTARTEGLYAEGGVFYVYLVYGMYHMLNIVTGEKDRPEAVLIRSVSDVTGPGRLTREYGIDMSIHTKTANRATGVWFEEGRNEVVKKHIHKTSRIGVDYAGEWAKKPYRFLVPEEYQKIYI